MNTLELINAGSSRLKSKALPWLDSELLLSEVLKTREEILINYRKNVSNRYYKI